MSLLNPLKFLLWKAKKKLQQLIFFDCFNGEKPSQPTQPSDFNFPKPSHEASGIKLPRPSPSCQPLGVSYWLPTFQPSIPIKTYFQQETGANGWGNNESQNYTDSHANCFFTSDNKLVLRAISNPELPSNKYTSARLVSKQKLDRPNGFVTARLTVPQAPGIWPAFWLLPAEPFIWPTDGEIDICETWNGDALNRSCLHWGNYNEVDCNKHRVIETLMDCPDIAHDFGLAWDQTKTPGAERGRLIWYVDKIPVMRAPIPEGIRPLQDFCILLNVAMGGNVCQGTLPNAGTYDLIVHDLCMLEEPYGGWQKFNHDWVTTKDGRTM